MEDSAADGHRHQLNAHTQSRPVSTRQTAQRASFDTALAHLRHLTNNPKVAFQDGQWEAIDALVNGRKKVLVVQRTGWGKSAVYFIATKLLRETGSGPTLIISPLVALMRNQASAGQAMGLSIETLNGETRQRLPEFLHRIRENDLDALLISPEQLGTAHFREHVLPILAETIGLLAIDEAHCLSEWGHDFRPDYQRIRLLVERLPRNTALVATTATATTRVVDDLRQAIGDTVTIAGPLLRDNLALHVLPDMEPHERLAWLAHYLSHAKGSAIVYTLKVADVDRIADWLRSTGLSAESYHGQLPPEHRKPIEDRFFLGVTRIVVATSALSLGYHNPHVRHVIHYETPNSPLAYYQEVGRAGRNASQAVGVLMQAGSSDAEFHEWAREHAMPRPGIAALVLEAMERHEYCTIPQLADELNLEESVIESALGILAVQSPATVGREGKGWFRTAVPFQRDAYAEVYEERRSIRQREWASIWAYRTNRSVCRMVTLLQDFGPLPDQYVCGRCDVCLGAMPLLVPLPPTLLHHAKRFYYAVHPELVPLPPRDGIALNALAITRYDDSPFKQMVQRAKYRGTRDPAMIQLACDALIAADWPHPPPLWVTAVPSRRNPAFVTWIASEIASQLRIPFHNAIQKTRDTSPQKDQVSPAHQRENVRNAFALGGDIPPGPVLVVDDMVDSGETLAEVCSLLRNHGCQHTHPFALAITAATSARTR